MQAYLDNSATTRPFDRVVDAMAAAMRESYFNPSSMYRPAIDVENNMKQLRRDILRNLPGAAGDVYFVSGGTEGNNLALLGTAALARGKRRFICSAVEHPSVLEPMRRIEEMGHEVMYMPVDGRGYVDLDALRGMLDGSVELVSCMHVNNEVGAIQPIAEIARLISERAPQAKLHVDGVQAFMREPFPGRFVDMYTLSGHKIHGPKGIGALYVKKGVRLAPRQIGGGQESAMRSGTENTPGLMGLMTAISTYGALDDPRGRLHALKRRLYDGLCAAVPDCLLNGPDIGEGAGHILNISFPGVRGEVMLHALEGEGVLVSTGSACSSKKRHLSPVLTAMGIDANRAEATIRFSLSPLTTEQEIDMAIEAAGRSYAMLKAFRRR
jgi:cysteine desulfurase